MEATLHRFVRLLRLGGRARLDPRGARRDARAPAQPGVLSSRAVLRTALRVALVKDQRDEPIFDEIFDAFFSLVRVGDDDDGHGHCHAHDDLADTGELESFTLSEEPSDTPEQGHEHGKPTSIQDYFKQEDLAQQYNLHQEANKIDLAALTDEIVLLQGEHRRATPTTATASQLSDRPAARRGRARQPGHVAGHAASTPS